LKSVAKPRSLLSLLEKCELALPFHDKGQFCFATRHKLKWLGLFEQAGTCSQVVFGTTSAA
ncbi:hypothetical protein, partial [Martelella sp. HB161492]|uniref:hypothetical protein n=1 Tax=Martelella sp. HB161492 TaxID=2720726 RepID=UPI001AED5B09